MGMLTVEQLKKVLPSNLSKGVDDEMLNEINKIIGNTELYEDYRNNLLSYTGVMKDGKYRTLDYVYAVKYVTHKLMGDSNIGAYVKTFPNRYQRLVDKGTSEKDISSYVLAYSKNRLVNLIMEQTLVPTHILNQDLYQKALNVQAELMMTAHSEKVRCDAANSILTQLKMPDVKKVELDIGIKEDSAISALKATTLELVRQQRLMLEGGVMSAKDMAHTGLVIDVEEVK